MLCDRDDNLTAADEGSRFRRKLLDMLCPLIEAELNFRISVEHSRLLVELREERLKNQQLEERYNALKEEMIRSRDAFEKAKAEWQALRETISKKPSLGALTGSLDSHPVPRPPETADAAVGMGQLGIQQHGQPMDPANSSPGRMMLLLNEEGPGPQNQDPLIELAHLIDDGSSLEDFPLKDMNIREKSPKPPDRKRESPKYLAPLRGNARKQAHAKDCQCCTKFYDIAGIGQECDRASHLKSVSRHRYVEEIQNTPPGFWDVNFTPRQ